MSLDEFRAVYSRRQRTGSFLAGTLLLLAITGCSTGLQGALDQARNLPSLIDKARLPTLDGLLNREPVTTSFDDALTEAPLLDGFSPPGEAFLPLSWLPRTEEGNYLLVPGLYSVEAQSYCIRAGTYGPGKGDGYLYAPIKGPRADIVQSVLKRSARRPDIEQKEVQLLLWAIIARTRLGDMPRERQHTALQLLTPRELFELNGGALGLIPPDMMQSWLAKVPSEVREIYEAERKLRDLLTSQVKPAFEDIERLAVLAGVAPAADLIRNVPRGRWSYHPRGYFVRFFPSSYSRTRIEVYVPRPFTVERDEWGRITALDDGGLLRVETTYRSPADRPEGSTDDLLAYRFRTLQLKERTSRVRPEAADKTLEKKDKGWVFQESPTPAPEKPANLLAWPARRQLSREARRSLTAAPAATAGGGPRGALDVVHYVQAVGAALAPPGTKNPRWVSTALQSLAKAPHSVLLAELPAPSSDRRRLAGRESQAEPPPALTLPAVYDPTENVAAPANRSGQRLVSGGVPLDGENLLWYERLPDCPCVWNERQWDGRRAPDRRGRMGTWDEPTFDARFTGLHPGAVHELRWIPDDGLAGQQCTYDRQGRLITGGLGAGTPDLLSPTADLDGLPLGNVIIHQDADVLTFRQLPCANYMLMWPPNQGDGCTANIVHAVPANRAELETCQEILDSLKAGRVARGG